jgi:hypothetical protein
MVFKVDAASRRVISKRRVERGETPRLLLRRDHEFFENAISSEETQPLQS